MLSKVSWVAEWTDGIDTYEAGYDKRGHRPTHNPDDGDIRTAQRGRRLVAGL